MTRKRYEGYISMELLVVASLAFIFAIFCLNKFNQSTQKVSTDLNKLFSESLSLVQNDNSFGGGGNVPPKPSDKKCLLPEGTILTIGTEYNDGTYTYKYKYAATSLSNWQLVQEDGWGVVLTDKTSTTPITEYPCTSINDKNITRMDHMFYKSQTISIDLSKFNTEHVISMEGMFMFTGYINLLDFSNFNTSNVRSMVNMFRETKVTSLDLSSFDMSHISPSGSYGMFIFSKATIGYARTQADADILNSSGNKPSDLNFVVK